MQKKLGSGNLKGRYQMGHLRLNNKIILKWVAEDYALAM